MGVQAKRVSFGRGYGRDERGRRRREGKKKTPHLHRVVDEENIGGDNHGEQDRDTNDSDGLDGRPETLGSLFGRLLELDLDSLPLRKQEGAAEVLSVEPRGMRRESQVSTASGRTTESGKLTSRIQDRR